MNLDFDFIDEDARERYKIRRKQDLHKCHEFLSKRDFDGIQTVGHNLKGNGISFGFPELSEIGERLEMSARASNMESVEKCIRSFEVWLSHQESPTKP